MPRYGYQLDLNQAPDDGPTSKVLIRREVLPKGISHVMELVQVAGLTGPQFDGVTSWAAMDEAALNAAFGTTFTSRGYLSPNVSPITPLGFSPNLEKVRNDVLDRDKVQEFLNFQNTIISIFLGVVGTIMSAALQYGITAAFPNLSDGLIEGISSIPSTVLSSAQDVGAFFDADVQLDVIEPSVRGWRWTAEEFKVNEVEVDDQYVSFITVGTENHACNVLAPDHEDSNTWTESGLNQTSRILAIPGPDCKEKGELRRPGTIMKSRRYNSLSSEWVTTNRAPFQESAITISSTNFARAGYVSFQSSLMREKIVSGLTGGKVVYDFEFTQSFPNAWTFDGTTGVASQQVGNWNGIVVDGKLLAFHDGATWHDAQGLFALDN
jgi:hypothetical protein